LQTLVGSCVGVALHDRVLRVGGLAHVVLPDSRGSADHPGKFADTAIPRLIDDLRRLGCGSPRGRLSARLVGGARMFGTGDVVAIGQSNQEAVERVLAALGIPVVARDLGGETGRRMILDTRTGAVLIRVPGGDEYQL
jgi:chemotaxis protein CheD